MKKKIIMKFIAILMLLIIVSSTFANLVIASTEINEATISIRGRCELHLQYYNTDRQAWSYISGVYVEHEENGVKYPAYCLNRELPGVGTQEDEYEYYTVDIESVLDDVRVWRTVINGYPYKTPQELGLADEYDAFLATKQAIYCILYDFDPVTRYRGADDRGTAMANAIVRMVNEGRYGTQTPYDAGVSISKIGDLKEEGEYYSQEYSVSAQVETASYTITSTAGLPNGSVIVDMYGNVNNTFGGSEHFKVKIPKYSMNNDINVIINIQAKCKTYPVFFGKTRIAGTQNYAVTYDPYGDVVGRANLNVKTNDGVLKINKTDSETSKPISGVTFQLLKEDGTIVANATTNENGIATFSGLYQGNYKLKEVATKENYILNKTEFSVNVEYNKETVLNITNDYKKGNLKIYKVDKDNNKIGLGNVVFDLYSEEFQKVIGTYTTDTNGEIQINNLRIGNYQLIERKTGKWYNLAEDTSINIEWNITDEIVIENELKKGQVKIIKVDAENNEIKLQGVKFQVLDINGKVLETIITDEDGEAMTSRYPIRDFSKLTIRESETLENYKLNTEPQTIVLEEDQIKTLTFKNELKKGQIKVIKVDKDNNEVKLEGVEFKVYDEDGNFIETLITDKNGEAVSGKLRIDKQYTVQETKTLEKYVLNEEIKTVVLKEDQITTITFENELKKGQIEVYKVDSEDNEIKLKGVEFEVINSNNEVVETIVTDNEGYAVTSRLPIGEYRLKETKTDNMHILNDEIIRVDVTTDIVSRLDITNERIKGQIKIIKTSEDDNFINGKEAGNPIENVKFEVCDSNNNIVDKITTSSDGTAITKLLDKGCYYIKEVESGEWYLLNENTFATEIKEHQEIVEVEITNESEKPSVDIEKTGLIQTTANQEIKYDFKIKNTGNVPLSNFTWYDYLPTDYVRVTKLITGTYNQDLNYSVYYKTNKNDYRLLKDNLNTQVNNYINFSNLELDADEYVTEFKADFGTADVGFESAINPYIFVRVNSDVQNDDAFTNKTRIEGYNKTYMVWDEDDHTTKIYEKEIEVKKLPRTGM